MSRFPMHHIFFSTVFLLNCQNVLPRKLTAGTWKYPLWKRGKHLQTTKFWVPAVSFCRGVVNQLSWLGPNPPRLSYPPRNMGLKPAFFRETKWCISKQLSGGAMVSILVQIFPPNYRPKMWTSVWSSACKHGGYAEVINVDQLVLGCLAAISPLLTRVQHPGWWWRISAMGGCFKCT